MIGYFFNIFRIWIVSVVRCQRSVVNLFQLVTKMVILKAAVGYVNELFAFLDSCYRQLKTVDGDH